MGSFGENWLFIRVSKSFTPICHSSPCVPNPLVLDEEGEDAAGVAIWKVTKS